MSIYGLHYFNAKGESGYFDTPDDPYFLGPSKSKLGLALFGNNTGIGWYFFREQGDEGEVRITFDNGCRAVYETTRTRIIVVGEKKPTIAWPTNAAVFNEDGSLDHVIALPAYIEHSFDGKITQQYPTEGFGHLKYDNGNIALGVYFSFQWIQLRIYNPFTKEWGAVIDTYRQ